jgi:hypothetical protein
LRVAVSKYKAVLAALAAAAACLYKLVAVDRTKVVREASCRLPPATVSAVALSTYREVTVAAEVDQ